MPDISGDTTMASGGILAEIASCQVEWTYLAHATGSQTHFHKVCLDKIAVDSRPGC